RPIGTCIAACERNSAVVKRPMTPSPTPYCFEAVSATAPTFAALKPGENASAKPARRARSRRTRARLQGGALALPVRARLSPVAPELHRAPRARAVRRFVVERPPAVAARLQPPPAPVDHRAERDRDHLIERIAVSRDGDAAGRVDLHGRSPGRRV